MNHIDQIKSCGLKVTGPRLKILNLFETRPDKHMSADDVYRIVLEEEMDIGVATVYRVLAQFEEAGILMRHHFESNKAVYELNGGIHHDHLLCLDCGKITEFFDEEIEDMQERIAKKNGYDIQDHSLYLYGICAECQSKKKK